MRSQEGNNEEVLLNITLDNSDNQYTSDLVQVLREFSRKQEESTGNITVFMINEKTNRDMAKIDYRALVREYENND